MPVAGKNAKTGNPQFPISEQEFMAGCGKTDDIACPRTAKSLHPGE